MSVRARAGAILAATFFITSPLFAAEPTTQELVEQIKQLRTKVEQLEARQNQSSAEITATIDQMVKDAQQRSRFLLQATDENLLAGHESNHFFIRSDDGNYLIIPSLELAMRNVTNFSRNNGDDSVENGFDIRRLRLRFEGHAITPDLTYAIQFTAPPNSGDARIDDAWVKYQFHPGWYVKGGQFKDPLLHEQLVSGRRQIAADRPLLVVEMTGSPENRVQGVTVMYDAAKQPWRLEAGFTDGITSENTNFRDFPVNSTNFGAVARLEYFAQGDRKAYDDFTALGNDKDLLVFGAAGDITQAGSDSVWLHTLDAQWENTRGVGLYAAYVGRIIETSDNDSYDWGIQAQGNYLFAPPRWEGFARYEFIHLDDEVNFVSGESEDSFHVFTLGVNYYIHRHYAKFTIDASYLPNGAPSDQPTLGILGADDSEFLLRGQFQLIL